MSDFPSVFYATLIGKSACKITAIRLWLGLAVCHHYISDNSKVLCDLC